MSDLTDSFILPPTKCDCVYAWTTLGTRSAVDLQKMPILAKKIHLFRWSSFWSWRLCKQVKLLHLVHRKPARIHWKANTPKTSHYLVRILVQRHNWAIFLRKCDRYRVMLNECLFPKIEFVPPGEATLDVLRPVFEDRIISHRADVVWPPRSWRRWTISCGVPSKLNITPTSQRQLTL